MNKIDFNKILRPIVIVSLLFLVLLFGLKTYNYFQKIINSKYPIVSITASNNKVYRKGTKIEAKDFKVKAIHENGKETILTSSDVKLKNNIASSHGKYTTVTVELKEDSNITCDVKVENSRKKLVAFNCGNPNIEDVQAVLYSNGELCFEGSGNVLQYQESDFPWINLSDVEEIDNEYEIESITFEDGVHPLSMDYWFQDLEYLTYVDPIPSSVESMQGTFYGCTSLETTPDYSKCNNLLNMKECFSGCVSLINGSVIPEKVKTIESTFEECTSMINAPDFSQANELENATSAFSGCTSLVNVILPANVKILDFTFMNCINLQQMPEIPESVVSMNSTFMDDTSLSTLTIIPVQVKDVSECFSGCTKISGMLWVDGNPQSTDGCFSEAAIATTVDLQGNSDIMDVIANTGENITVDGKEPNPELASYEDVMGYEE